MTNALGGISSMILNLSGITPTSSFLSDEKAETSSLKSTEPNEKQSNRTYPTKSRPTTKDVYNTNLNVL